MKKKQDLEENIFGFVDISHRRYKLRRDVDQIPMYVNMYMEMLTYMDMDVDMSVFLELYVDVDVEVEVDVDGEGHGGE
jgi:hypothetical protein